jgi:uncharacterized protein (UPF0332 family)
MKPFAWDDFLAFAEELQRNRSDEAAMRSAVSRAYYAVFHLSLHFLEQHHGAVTSMANRHQAVWHEFQRGPDKSWKAISRLGDRLKLRRVDADYLLKQRDWVKEAKAALTEAEQIQYWLQQITKHQIPPS